MQRWRKSLAIEKLALHCVQDKLGLEVELGLGIMTWNEYRAEWYVGKACNRRDTGGRAGRRENRIRDAELGSFEIPPAEL